MSVRRTRSAAAAMLLVPLLAGCGGDAGPLELPGYGGMVVDGGQSDAVWFRVSGCLAEGHDPTDVMITGLSVEPAGDHVEARATWNDDSEIVIAKPGEPPAAYRPVTATSHTGGTLDECSLDLAVVLSADKDPVVVEAVTVRYEVDGKEHTARTSLDGTLCPVGTRAGDGGQRSCRRTGDS